MDKASTNISSSTDTRSDNATAETLNNEIEVLQMYPMERKTRNLAIVFSHKNYFKNEPKQRIGVEADCDKLKSVLQTFNFDIKIYKDQTKNQISEILNKVSQTDQSDTDCLLIVVMTHGHPGQLWAYEETYNTFELWHPFSKKRCPSLIGKPKLFFIQACRGKEVDSGINLECQENTQYQYELSSMNTSPDTTLIRHSSKELDVRHTPDEEDFLIGYATVPDYYAYCEEYGSWFIQEICSIFEKYGKNYDLLTLLTFVSQRVAINYVSKCSKEKKYNDKKQIPCIISTLTKRLCFFPEQAEEVPEEFEIDPM